MCVTCSPHVPRALFFNLCLCHVFPSCTTCFIPQFGPVSRVFLMYHVFYSCHVCYMFYYFQGDSDRCQAEVHEAVASPPAPQDDQQGSRPQGRLRLCHDLPQVNHCKCYNVGCWENSKFYRCSRNQSITQVLKEKWSGALKTLSLTSRIFLNV